jgi:hypothetical protein
MKPTPNDIDALRDAYNRYFETRLGLEWRLRVGRDLPWGSGEPRPVWLPDSPSEADCALAADHFRSLLDPAAEPTDGDWLRFDYDANADQLLAMADERVRFAVDTAAATPSNEETDNE